MDAKENKHTDIRLSRQSSEVRFWPTSAVQCKTSIDPIQTSLKIADSRAMAGGHSAASCTNFAVAPLP